MAKKKTRLQKSTAILDTAIEAKWCYVDADNKFKYEENTYAISEDVKEYKVIDKYNEVDNYMNKAEMELIFVVKDKDHNLTYYNQHLELINNKKVNKD